MADGSFGEREIFIDLTIAPAARIIRDAAVEGRAVHIDSIRINGTANAAGAGDIILRKQSATGPVVFKLNAPTASAHDGTMTPNSFTFAGLYMDSVVNAWQAGSHMIIYTR